MFRLLYIGKSNKRYTHNKIYRSFGAVPFISVQDNKGCMRQYGTVVYAGFTGSPGINDLKFFNENFKFINEQEYVKLQRKLKLKILNK